MSGFNLKRVLAQQVAQQQEGLVLDEQGRPKRLFHGTTHNFDAFDTERANHENSMGKAVYLTDSPEDASANYAGIGPDLENRISQLTDQLMNEAQGDWKDNRFVARMRAKARKQLMGQHKGAVYPVQVRMKNPLVLDPKSQQRYDQLVTCPEGEDDDYKENQEGSAYKLWQALLDVGSEMGVDGGAVWEKLNEVVDMTDEPLVYQVDQALREVTGNLDDPSTGDLICHEFIRKVYQRMGYDGVVMDAYSYFVPQRRKDPYGGAYTTQGMNIAPGTKHYVVFDPRSIKSIYNPNPNWNDPKLTAGIKQQAASMSEIVRNPGRYGYEKCPECGGGTPGRKSSCGRCNGWGVLPTKTIPKTLVIQRSIVGPTANPQSFPEVRRHNIPAFIYRIDGGNIQNVFTHDNTDDTAKTIHALWNTGAYDKLVGQDLQSGVEKDLTDLAKDGAWGNDLRGELRNLASPGVAYISQARQKQIADEKLNRDVTEAFGLSAEELERITKEMAPKPAKDWHVL